MKFVDVVQFCSGHLENCSQKLSERFDTMINEDEDALHREALWCTQAKQLLWNVPHLSRIKPPTFFNYVVTKDICFAAMLNIFLCKLTFDERSTQSKVKHQIKHQNSGNTKLVLTNRQESQCLLWMLSYLSFI